MKVEECIAEGLLKKIEPDANKAFLSVEMAEHKLGLAEKELESAIYESAIISAYASMFHSARAILFRDGFKERSHYAIYLYLDEKYSNKIERRLLNEFNSLRLERHELMYGLSLKAIEGNEIEAENTVRLAKEFLDSIKKILKNKSV